MAPFPSSYEQCMLLYKVACGALFAVPSLSLSSLFGMPLSSSGGEPVEYFAWASLLAALAGLLASRMREAALGYEEFSAAHLQKAVRVHNPITISGRGLRLFEIMGPSDEDSRSSESTATGERGPPRPRIKATAGVMDTATLVRRLESDRANLRTIPLALLPAVSTVPQMIARQPLEDREIRALFRALSRGTLAHAGRGTTAVELARLADACSRMDRPNPVMIAAHENRLTVYRQGTGWIFDIGE